MMDVASLREKAALCLRIAKGLSWNNPGRLQLAELAERFERQAKEIDLQNREISEKALKNVLLPSLDLFAYYGGSGLAGTQNPANLCVNQSLQQQQSGFCAGPNPSFGGQTVIPAAGSNSYSSSLSDLVNSTAPDKGVGFTLNIPIRNRQAQALQVRGEL